MKYLYLIKYQDPSIFIDKKELSHVEIFHPDNLVIWCKKKNIYSITVIQSIEE